MRKDYYNLFYNNGGRKTVNNLDYKKTYSFFNDEKNNNNKQEYKTLTDDHYPLTHAQGLDRAYSLPNGVYIHGDTAYVAGTKSYGDAYDDLKIPFNLTSHTQRYKDLDNTIKYNSDVKQLVSHSLGGAVSLEYDKNNPGKYRTITYGSPTLSLGANSNEERYKNLGDPISFLDIGARTNTLKSLNPFTLHSYKNFNNKTENSINNNNED